MFSKTTQINLLSYPDKILSQSDNTAIDLKQTWQLSSADDQPI